MAPTLNIAPERIASARATSRTRSEMADKLGLYTDNSVYKLLRRYQLPLFGKATELHSEDTKQAVIALYQGGKAQLDISAITGVPVSSVTGILQRAGVWQRRKAAQTAAQPAPKPETKNRVVKPPRFVVDNFMPREADLTPLHLTFAELGRAQCRYPYGDGPITFCGHVAEGSYCEKHRALAYKPAEARNRAPRPR